MHRPQRLNEPLGEAHNDFFGFPSFPRSIYHTGPAWPLPEPPEAWRVPKEARPVCIHAISSVWHEVGERIFKYFDSIGLKWTSIDPVRFAETSIYQSVLNTPSPLFLWVGVLPGSLSPELAKGPALRCKEILSEYGITDVEIAFRNSTYTRYAREQLFDHVPSKSVDVDPTANIRVPFTPTLGLKIASKASPYVEGTGCLYLCEGNGSDRVFLLTTRHVSLPLSKYPNELYYFTKGYRMPRRWIIHIGATAFQDALEAISKDIFHWDLMVGHYNDELESVDEHIEGEDPKITSKRQTIKSELEVAEKSKASGFEFLQDISTSWSLQRNRIIGHVIYSPPISIITGDRSFTEDWALIELDRDKFNWDTFRGNVLHLGMFIPLRSSILTNFDN